MDDLKKYLQQHKEEMDFDEPGNAVWMQIIKEKHQTKGRKVAIFIRYAAAAIIFTAVVITGIKFSTKKDVEQLATNEKIPFETQKKIPADSGVLIAGKEENNFNKDVIAPTVKPLAKKLKPVDERYEMMESFKENYARLVSYQLSSIRSTALHAEAPVYFDDFKERITQMDLDEIAIRNRIKEKGMSNNLLEQLINVYQQKLDVLKSLQAEINKMNERVPATDSTNKYYLNI